MEFIVLLDKDSAIGTFLMSMRGKIGGASGSMDLPGASHPYVIARNLDWSKLPSFVGMTHVRNPGAQEEMERELVVPAAAVLSVMPVEPSAIPQQGEQQTPPPSLH